jgi:peptidoglycan hydrolase CwlO-like protein
MERILHNRLSFIFILLIVVFLTQIFSLLGNSNQIEKIKYIKSEMKTIQSNIDKVYESNKKLDKKIEGFKLDIESLDEGITANNKKIDKLKQDEKTKIDNFKHYNARMWESYFTSRYAKK